MKQILFAASLLTLSLSTYAAPSFKDEIAPTQIHHWTGFYAGINAGAVNHTLDLTDADAASFLATLRQESNPKWTAGLQAGYRHELDMNVLAGVYGLELNVNFANAAFEKQYGSDFALYTLHSSNQLKTTSTLELMAGLAADRLLLFLSGGVSYAHIDGTTRNLDSLAFFNKFSVRKNAFGTVLGGGLEYALTNQLSARFKIDVLTPTTYSTKDNVDNHYQVGNHIVQGTVGLNYQLSC